MLALKRQGRCLELCCGDGFNTFHFYSPLVAEMVAVDFDPTALAHARADNAHPSIRYVQADIRTWRPEGWFDNVVWDAAIEHFTEIEIAAIMTMIRTAMAEGAVLSGYTLVESGHGKALEHHEREFRSKQDLADFLTPHFRNVTVFETIHPTRHNLYFYASDAAIPFHPDWPHALQITR